MLPEPNVSGCLTKNDQIRVALDLNEEWNNATGGNLTMSCVAATKTFIAEHPQAVADFLADLQQSITLPSMMFLLLRPCVLSMVL